MTPKAEAQVVPDFTLPLPSEVSTTPSGSGTLINLSGGTPAGPNLFHSVAEFSLGTNDIAQFQLDPQQIETVFVRVTGSETSRIDGTLAADADLFFLNPNGFVFGPNATLAVAGSFVASSGDRIQFADGTTFGTPSPSSPTGSPILSVSVPSGIQYGSNLNTSNPGSITVQGNGNGLVLDPTTGEIFKGDRSPGLAVPSGQTLALLGGPLRLDGGNLTASGGRIALAAAQDGTIQLSPDALGWQVDASTAQGFNDIQLQNAASAEVSAAGGGSIDVQGRQVQLLGGSTLLSETTGNGSGEGIRVTATEQLTLSGIAFDPNLGFPAFPSSIVAEVTAGATGQGGDIFLSTPTLDLSEGAAISSSTYGDGNAGNLTVTAQQILLEGANAFGPSGLGSVVGNFATGDGGDVQLTTELLLATGSGAVSTFAFGSGQGGNLRVNATDIALVGGSPDGPSGLFAGSFLGNSGQLSIETDSLEILDGAQIAASTFGPGNGGAVAIAANSIALSGTSPSGQPGGIFSSVEAPDAPGQAGNVAIAAQALRVSDGAQVATSTVGLGNAGQLTVQGGSVTIEGVSPLGIASGLFSTVEPGATGQGGALQLDVEQLQVLGGGAIATATAGAGDAATLSVTAETVLLSGQSSFGRSGLFASAIEADGAGGDIVVNASKLSVEDGATINASNFPSSFSGNAPGEFPGGPGPSPGQGPAGNVNLVVDELTVSDQALVTTATAGGDRGNIDIQARLIALRRGAGISANALNTATGGNIRIDADFITAVPSENSDITANAQQAQGGRIELSAQGIFGPAFSDRLTPNSDITASSDIGLDGTVEINELNVNPASDLAELPSGVVDNSDRIVAGCPSESSATFVASGRGGLPDGPGAGLQDRFVLQGFETSPEEHFQSVSPGNREAQLTVEPESASNSEDHHSNPQTITEAQGWQRNRRGEVQLLANAAAHGAPRNALNCLKGVL